jgi:hypothetical protein
VARAFRKAPVVAELRAVLRANRLVHPRALAYWHSIGNSFQAGAVPHRTGGLMRLFSKTINIFLLVGELVKLVQRSRGVPNKQFWPFQQGIKNQNENARDVRCSSFNRSLMLQRYRPSSGDERGDAGTVTFTVLSVRVAVKRPATGSHKGWG